MENILIRRDKNYIELLEHLIDPNLNTQPLPKQISPPDPSDSEDSTWTKSIKEFLDDKNKQLLSALQQMKEGQNQIIYSDEDHKKILYLLNENLTPGLIELGTIAVRT